MLKCLGYEMKTICADCAREIEVGNNVMLVPSLVLSVVLVALGIYALWKLTEPAPIPPVGLSPAELKELDRIARMNDEPSQVALPFHGNVKDDEPSA